MLKIHTFNVILQTVTASAMLRIARLEAKKTICHQERTQTASKYPNKRRGNYSLFNNMSLDYCKIERVHKGLELRERMTLMF